MPPGASEAQQEYWQEELGRVRKYGANSVISYTYAPASLMGV